MTMVHQVQEKSRKRDRRTAELSYDPGSTPGAEMGVGVGVVMGPVGGGSVDHIRPPPMKMSRLGMFETYQPWVLQTYGDTAKTKTITKNKYQRILQILRGDFIDNETSKFKLWVKGRGFRIGPPPGYFHPGVLDPAMNALSQPGVDYSPEKDPCPDIYVQTGTIKVGLFTFFKILSSWWLTK